MSTVDHDNGTDITPHVLRKDTPYLTVSHFSQGARGGPSGQTPRAIFG